MKNILPEILKGLEKAPDPDRVSIYGQTSPKIKALLHRLAERLPADECYLEIGCLRGATLVSALLDLKNIMAYACDNFSQLPQFAGEKHLSMNLARYGKRLPKINLRNMDCFALAREPKPFEKPVGIYFYDADHSEESQFKAIVELERHLAREAVVLVDDWNWKAVKAGTWRGIKKIAAEKVEFYDLTSPRPRCKEHYWNGVGAFHLTRRKS